MKDIPDGSVDLVLTDPPYNIGKAKWDKIPDYINWCGKWIKECERVLKDNGSFYFWHNDMAQIAQLMEWIRQNTKFVYNSFCIWDKGDFRALAWKNPSEANNLRSWFNTAEYCLAYTFWFNAPDRGARIGEKTMYSTLKKYFRDEKAKCEKSGIDIDCYVPRTSNFHYFANGSSFNLPTEKNYNKLQATGFFPKPLAVLREEYNSYQREYINARAEYNNQRYIHNLAPNHKNIWKSTGRNNGKQHPTQKPLDLMERIVKTSSKEDGVILDPFMGSGSTGVACINTGRDFIGIELDEGYFDIAQSRITTAKAQRRMEG